MPINFRPATFEDVPMLRHWDEQPHVKASDPNDDWMWEETLAREMPGFEQLVAELDGRPIGFMQILDPEIEESQYWGEMPAGYRAFDIWIGLEQDLGKGYGSEMMRLAIAQCFAVPEVHTIMIDPLVSNVRAHRFYERLGFVRQERRKFGTDECYVYHLKRDDWEDSKKERASKR